MRKKAEKIYLQRNIQASYRKKKQLNKQTENDNKLAMIIVDICVVLGIIVLYLNAFVKEF